MAPQTENIKVLWVQERSPDIRFFSLKMSQQATPLQVPQWSPYVKRYLLTGHFYISLDISLYLKGPIKKSVSPCCPNACPYGERYLLTGHFYMSLNKSLYLKGPFHQDMP
jgi:hypothetical protein